ncbi:MAG TPA: DsbA family oxidoreductase [Candidatus Binataceae bacterium]|nr:DsbA family oxidoreductase [Candidatus Binataceae bacterium]
MAFKLQMFSDFICPFCYIGFRTARKIAPELGFEIEWRSFQIHPEWPAEGMPASEYRRAMDPETRRAIWARIEAMAEAAGFTMKSPEVLANSRLALEANEFAGECGRQADFEERVYKDYFNQGLNIGVRGVVMDLAAEAGIDRADLDAALDSGRYSMRLKNNALIARQRGVDGVPTFFLGDYPLVGAQSEDVMRQILGRYAQKLSSAE